MRHHIPFFWKRKRITWESWKSFPEVTKAFLSVVDQPFQFLQVNSTAMKLLERFTCVFYDKTTPLVSVNELRTGVILQRANMLENIRPTQVIPLPFIVIFAVFSPSTLKQGSLSGKHLG